jgi:hypothetical protein
MPPAVLDSSILNDIEGLLDLTDTTISKCARSWEEERPRMHIAHTSGSRILDKFDALMGDLWRLNEAAKSLLEFGPGLLKLADEERSSLTSLVLTSSVAVQNIYDIVRTDPATLFRSSSSVPRQDDLLFYQKSIANNVYFMKAFIAPPNGLRNHDPSSSSYASTSSPNDQVSNEQPQRQSPEIRNEYQNVLNRAGYSNPSSDDIFVSRSVSNPTTALSTTSSATQLTAWSSPYDERSYDTTGSYYSPPIRPPLPTRKPVSPSYPHQTSAQREYIPYGLSPKLPAGWATHWDDGSKK